MRFTEKTQATKDRAGSKQPNKTNFEKARRQKHARMEQYCSPLLIPRSERVFKYEDLESLLGSKRMHFLKLARGVCARLRDPSIESPTKFMRRLDGDGDNWLREAILSRIEKLPEGRDATPHIYRSAIFGLGIAGYHVNRSFIPRLLLLLHDKIPEVTVAVTLSESTDPAKPSNLVQGKENQKPLITLDVWTLARNLESSIRRFFGNRSPETGQLISPERTAVGTTIRRICKVASISRLKELEEQVKTPPELIFNALQIHLRSALIYEMVRLELKNDVVIGRRLETRATSDMGIEERINVLARLYEAAYGQPDIALPYVFDKPLPTAFLEKAGGYVMRKGSAFSGLSTSEQELSDFSSRLLTLAFKEFVGADLSDRLNWKRMIEFDKLELLPEDKFRLVERALWLDDEGL